MSTPQLPWTDEFIKTATLADLRSVPEDQIQTINDILIEDFSAQSLGRKAQRHQKRREDRAKDELPPAPRKPLFDDAPGRDPVVQIVQDRKLADFGYDIYRTSFDDEERYQRWFKEFDRIQDQALVDAQGGELIADNSFFPIDDDPELQDISWSELRESHVVIEEDNPYGPGLEFGAFLVVDKDVIDAGLEPKPGILPWIWVVDQHFDHSTLESGTDQGYRGVCKVALESLLPDLWPLLVTGTPLRSLWAACPFDDEHPVWTNAFGL